MRRGAFSLGRAVFLTCLLTSALFVSPILAAEPGFGHHHPEGTSAHLHPIDGVLGFTVFPDSVTTVLFVALIFCTTVAVERAAAPCPFGPANNIRAPPVGV